MAQPDVNRGVVSDPAEMGIGSWSREVWRRRYLVVLVTLAAVNAALLVTYLAPQTFEATSAVKVSSGDINSGVQSSGQSATLLATQVQVLQSTQVASDVVQRLGGDVDVLGVVVEGVPESQVATITVRARTAAGAAEAANTFAVAYDERRDAGVVSEATSRAESVGNLVDELSAELEQLQGEVDAESTRVNLEQARITVTRDNAARQGVSLGPEDVVVPNTSALSALQARYAEVASDLSILRTQLTTYELAIASGDGGVAIVSAATEPMSPSSPGAVERGLLGGLLGLALGVGLSLLLALRDTRLHDAAALRRSLPGIPVLALVPGRRRRPSSVLDVEGVLFPAALDPMIDRYREVALSMMLSSGGSIRAVLVSDTTDGEDRTAAAGALAVALARGGRRVILVDAVEATDPLRSSGLTDVLAGTTVLSRALVPVEVPGSGSLAVLGSGRQQSSTLKLHESELAQLLAALTEEADVVVIRSGSLLGDGAASLLVPHVDGTILPVLLQVTRGPDLARAVSKLEGLGAEVLGAVVHEGPVGSTRSRSGRVRARPNRATPAGSMSDPFPQAVTPDTARNVSSSSRS